MTYDYVNFACTLSTVYDTPGLYADLTACETAVSDGTVQPVLILNPPWSAVKKASLPLLINKLGDGYQQTVFQGVDQINEEWSITSPILIGTEVDGLLGHLRSLSTGSFLWSPNNGVIPWREFCADQWTKVRLGVNHSQVTSTFRSVTIGKDLPIVPIPPIIDAPFSADFTDLTGRHTLTSPDFGEANPPAIVDSGSLLFRSLAGHVFTGVSEDFDLTNYQSIDNEDPENPQYNFTIEFKASIPSEYGTNNNYATLLSIGGNTTDYTGDYLEIAKMRSGISNVWYFAAPSVYVPTLANVTLGEFHHAALCRSGSAIRFFLDGFLQAELDADSAFYRTVTSTDFKLWLGASTQAVGAGACQGVRIKEVKITPAALYTGASFTPP